MSFQLKTSARLSELHCSEALTDWDLDQELKLQTTTDHLHHDDQVCDQFPVPGPSDRASRRNDDFIFYDRTTDKFVKPSPWLMVNPNIVCPINYGLNGENDGVQTPLLPPVLPPPSPPVSPPELPPLSTPPLPPPSAMLTSRDAPRRNSASTLRQNQVRNEEVSHRPAQGQRRPRTTRTRVNQPVMNAGGWPRPPVNYCILIALALKNSYSGSLRVQQIYSFTREHFPFFQTAPDGWKNTIRHNLCFNSSFRKTCNTLRRDGKRKSCFWHLTVDGHRRLRDELWALTEESMQQLERSMTRPGERVPVPVPAPGEHVPVPVPALGEHVHFGRVAACGKNCA
ncbi:forkhead box protein R1 [Sphaeramia orbicularis]|uniref:forkhead box protein R1 n=1 Tax=Sphaeramia orbicularis TaxID=375764 RepID=UPI00117F1A21|nr:forkhead box protein N5-like [Sphaeramia orbicularis]